MRSKEKRKVVKHKHSIESLIKDLMNDDSMMRNEAKLELVKLGDCMIDFLSALVYNSHDHVRYETIKVMVEIKSALAIPFFVDALEDDVSSIRSLAAKGLIDLEDQGLNAVLDALIECKNS